MWNMQNRNTPLNFEDFTAMLLDEEMHTRTRGMEKIEPSQLEQRKKRVRNQVTHLLQKTKRGSRRSSAYNKVEHKQNECRKKLVRTV